MSHITGVSQQQLATLQRAAEKIVATFDSNRDGAIADDERLQLVETRQVGIINKQYRELYRGTDTARFRLADKDRNGKLTAKEMVEFFLDDIDADRDGRLSWKEKHWDNDLDTGLHWRFDRYFQADRPASEGCR